MSSISSFDDDGGDGIRPRHFKHLIYSLCMILWFGPISLAIGIFATGLFYGPKTIFPHVVFLSQNTFHEIHFGIDVLWKLYLKHRNKAP
jgi:hypothetical protein